MCSSSKLSNSKSSILNFYAMPSAPSRVLMCCASWAERFPKAPDSHGLTFKAKSTLDCNAESKESAFAMRSMVIRSRCTIKRAVYCEWKPPSCSQRNLEFTELKKANPKLRSAAEFCAKASAISIGVANCVGLLINVTLRLWPVSPAQTLFCKKLLKSVARSAIMASAIARSMLWRRRITPYYWLVAGESSLSAAFGTPSRALCSSPPTNLNPTKTELSRGSAAITRQFALLRAHGLIRKLPHTHRYQISAKGRRIITALLAACYADVEQLTKMAA